MKTSNFLQIFLFLLSLFFTGCNFLGSYERGNGKETTTTRELSRFNEIYISGNFEINLEKAKQEGVIIEADENLEPLIKTSVNGNRLTISSDKKLISIKKIKVTIHYNKLSEIDISGATLFKSNDLVEAKDLSLKLGGAGVIDLKLKANNLNAELSGAGLVKLNGYVTNSRISLSGAGGLDAYGLETNNCTIDVSGIGGAKINVKGKLDANITGVGGIEYIGHPAEIEKNVSGVGTIKEGTEENQDSIQ